MRDPGTVKPLEELEREQEQENARGDQIGEQNEDISLAEALLSSNDAQDGDGSAEAFSLTPVKSTGEGRWCRKVRTHAPINDHSLDDEIQLKCISPRICIVLGSKTGEDTSLQRMQSMRP